MSSYERTGWRDQELSARHRNWGFNCPSVDLDFLMVEYNAGLPVAVVEYKRHTASRVDLRHPTYRALTAIADRAELPFLLAFYWPESWSFYVYPVNGCAQAIYTEDRRLLSERRYVLSLYHLRKLKIEEHVIARLHREPPPASDPLPVIIDGASEQRHA